MPSIDFIVIAAYIGIVVVLGCALARKSRTTSEFMAAGRSLPGWAVGLSIFGSYVSSISFLANPGKSFADNWNPFVFSLSLPVAAWVAVRYFVPYFRNTGDVSAYTHLEHRFGGWARTYAVICFLLVQLARVATILYLVALTLAPMLDWNISSIIICTGLLVTVYTLLGGIEAVIWTDVVQSGVLTLGLLITIVAILSQTPGGASHIVEVAIRDHKFSLGSFGGSLSEPTFWVVLAYGLFVNLQNFAVDQTYVQRYVTAKSERAATSSVWLGALLYLPISAILFFVGTGLYVFYLSRPELLPAGDMPPDAVFPHFIFAQLPAGVSGLLIAAVLAAAMSSVDSSLNCSATLVLCDIYKKYLRPLAGERESMAVLYSATLLCGIAGTAAGLWMTNAAKVLDVWWQLAGVAGGGVLGLMLMARFIPRVRGPHALAGVAVGLLVILWMTAAHFSFPLSPLPFMRSPFHGFLTIVFGTLTIVVVGSVAALFAPLSQAHSSPTETKQ